MKKFSFVFSLLLLAALVLSACGANNGTGNNTGLTTPAPGLDVTQEPDAGTLPDTAATPTLEVVDETPEVEELELTPTLDAGDMEVTPEAGVGEGMELTETPMAEVPVTGAEADVCRVDHLSNLFDFDVQDQTGQVIGEVDAVVVLRDTTTSLGAGTGVEGEVTDEMTTPEATDDLTTTPAADDMTTPEAADDLTTTPAAGEDAGMDQSGVTGTLTSPGANPMVAYLVVDIDGENELGLEDRDVLVPFAAFQPVDQAAAPATDDMAAGDCFVTLNVDTTALQGAPSFEDDNWEELTAEGADFTTYNDFWATQNVVIPTTGVDGAAQYGNPVVFEDNFDDIDVENLDGDDLGEIENFVIDPQTGELRYAILVAGEFLGLGGRYIPVPMSNIFWLQTDDDVDDLGEMVINVPEDTFETAPSFENLDEFDTTVEGWDTEIETFWTNLQNNLNETTNP